jgi:hypothetical protein
MSSLDGIRGILCDGPARRVRDGLDVWDLGVGPWWKLFTDFRRLDSTKKRILEAAWALPSPLYLVPPEPVPARLAPFLVREAPGAWRVKRDGSAAELHGTELDEGNWVLYAAPRPARQPIPNTFKTDPAALLAFMRAGEMELLIDSFYDDREWRVAVAGGDQEPASH